MKKTLAFILVAAMILCMAPAFSLFAAEVVEIDSAEDFAAIKDNLGGSYKLTADITITEPISYKNEGAWFTGTLDGNGKTITINFTDNDRARTGLFCSAGGCTIKNLTVVGTLNSYGNSCSGLIGTLKGDGQVTIDNVTVDIDLPYADQDNGSGAFIGCVEDGNAKVTITNSTNKGDVAGNKAGGFIGHVQGGDAKIVLENCVNEGTVECGNRYADYRGAGGFIGVVNNGSSAVTLKNCTNKGAVVGKYAVANAYIGHNNSGNYTCEGCSNTGVVTSGGLVLSAELAVARDAGIWGGAGFNFNMGEKKLSGSPNFHGLPQLTDYTAYVNGVKTDKVALTEVVGGNRQVDVVVTEVDPALIDGFVSVTIVWANGKYSTFGCPAPAKAAMDLMEIGTAEELMALSAAYAEHGRGFLGAYEIKITADIDMTGKAWTPINDAIFTLNGQGHTISGLTVTVDSTAKGDYGLLVNTLANQNANGRIKDLTIKDSIIVVNSTATELSTKYAGNKGVNVGAVVGRTDRGALNNVNLENVTVKVTGIACVGALAGFREWEAPDDVISGNLKNVLIDAPDAQVGVISGYSYHVDGSITNFTAEVGGNVTDDAGAVKLNGATGDDYKKTEGENVSVTLKADATGCCLHTNTKVEGKVDATVDAEGYTGDTVCADCGKVLATGESIDKLDPPPATQEPTPAPTGDSVVALVVLAVVSLLGMAVVSKKRV